jgi:hypothetical protein
MLKATARAVHGCALRLNWAKGKAARAGAFMRVTGTGVWDGGVSTPRYSQVSSEKHETAAEARAEE